MALPIEAEREKLIETIRGARSLIVIGDTGSGKTTQLPQYLLDSGVADSRPIVVTQPRRVAAVSVAERVAAERGGRVGGEVGYAVRFDQCHSARTRVKYVTDGCLLRECMDDPSLSRYSVVVLDEAHVRSTETDVLFGLVKRNVLRGHGAYQLARRPDSSGDASREDVADSCGPARTLPPPKLVVMSATLEAGMFSEYFEAEVFRVPGRAFPVEISYTNMVDEKDLQSSGYVSKAVQVAMEIHMSEDEGDVLIFLTGQAEIDRACKELFERSEKIDYRHDVLCQTVSGLMILPLFGNMTSDNQANIFRPAEPGIRKIIVATDIASTSVTIDGVVYVVDAGFVKQKSYNPSTSLDALVVSPISRSEAKQRAGRAGRTRPGICFRLYSERFMDEQMYDFTLPEIKRTSLTSVVLTLKTLGIRDVLAFPYPEPPSDKLLRDALRQLYWYDALNLDGEITTIGRKMATFPVSPSLARVLLFAATERIAEPVLAIVAMLSVEQIYVRPPRKSELLDANDRHEELRAGRDDFMALLHIYREFCGADRPRQWCRQHYIHYRALTSAAKVREQLEQLLQSAAPAAFAGGRRGGTVGPSEADVAQAIRRALCQGYFDHVARRIGPAFRTMDGHGSTVHVHPGSGLFNEQDDLEWVLYHEVVRTSKIYMRTVTPIRYEWVKPLLPKLHQVEAAMMAGDGSVSAADRRAMPNLEGPGKAMEPSADARSTAASSGQRRNTETDVDAARQRYLARKRARTR